MIRRFLFLISILLSFKANSATAVIANIENPDLNLNLIENIFTFKETHVNGQLITVYIKPIDSIEHEIFIFKWFGLTSYKYNRILNVVKLNKPHIRFVEVKSDYEMALKVSNSLNSIGYLDDVSLVSNKKVNIIYFPYGEM